MQVPRPTVSVINPKETHAITLTVGISPMMFGRMIETRSKPAPDTKEAESDNMQALKRSLWVRPVTWFPRYPTMTLMIAVAEIAVTQQDTLNPTFSTAAWTSPSEASGVDAATMGNPDSVCWFPSRSLHGNKKEKIQEIWFNSVKVFTFSSSY